MSETQVRHLLNWKDYSDEEIKSVLSLAKDVKDRPLSYKHHLEGMTLIMLFQKNSTRTRVSFEMAMTETGGHGIFLDWNHTNFNLTKIGYEAGFLSTNAHVIMARMKRFADLQEMSAMSKVPVINGCCEMYHPCQAMADMLTILENRGSLRGAKLTYIGVHNNVVNSLMSLCAALDVNLTLVCPLTPEDAVDPDIKDRIVKKGLLSETLNLTEAVMSSEFIYTDTWVNMEFFDDPAMKKMKDERVELMLPFQINAALMEKTKAKIMHDMPIHPGYEIAEDMVTHPDSVIFEQAGNRLHAQKAIMLMLLGKAKSAMEPRGQEVWI